MKIILIAISIFLFSGCFAQDHKKELEGIEDKMFEIMQTAERLDRQRIKRQKALINNDDRYQKLDEALYQSTKNKEYSLYRKLSREKSKYRKNLYKNDGKLQEIKDEEILF